MDPALIASRLLGVRVPVDVSGNAAPDRVDVFGCVRLGRLIHIDRAGFIRAGPLGVVQRGGELHTIAQTPGCPCIRLMRRRGLKLCSPCAR